MSDVRGGDGASSEDELRRQVAWMLDRLCEPEVLERLTTDELAALVEVFRGPYERKRRGE